MSIGFFIEQEAAERNSVNIDKTKYLIPLFVGMMMNADSNFMAKEKSVSATLSPVWPSYPGVVLRRGMQGPSITQVQERLNELGANPRLATDGDDVIIGLYQKSQ